MIAFSGFSYEETTGYCRGGGNWPGLSTAWYCLDEEGNPGTRRLMTKEECQSECDNTDDCGAFDRALTDQSPCCLFTEGHTGNGGAGRACFVREVPTTDMSVGVAAASVPHGTSSEDVPSSTEWSGSSGVMIMAGICIGLIVVLVLIVLKQMEGKEASKAIEAIHVPESSVAQESSSAVTGSVPTSHTKEETANELVVEMSEVVDAPKVVHVADGTVEVKTETV